MSNVHVALKTLRRIDEIVKADQGSAYRGWLKQVMPHIGDAYRTDEDGHRTHMGASLLGQECARAIWYNFHWTTKSNFEGRMIRLFNRGHIEEARFIALLLMIGVHVYQQDEEGKQFRISFADGHAGGSGDGIAHYVPDLHHDTQALCEFKTHGEKSFIELTGPLDEWRDYVAGKSTHFTGKGVREAKFEHYVQMQLYMHKMGLPVALYVAVNKNTDDLYAELVMLDTSMAEQFVTRGEKLVWMPLPPDKINKSPGFFKCRFCDHRPACHLKEIPDRNCRTCQHSEPVANGQWNCTLLNKLLTKEEQLSGCQQYDMARIYGV